MPYKSEFLFYAKLDIVIAWGNTLLPHARLPNLLSQRENERLARQLVGVPSRCHSVLYSQSARKGAF
jgi:hypothetical protein